MNSGAFFLSITLPPHCDEANPMTRVFSLLATALLLSLPVVAPGAARPDDATVRERIAARFPGVEVENVRPAPIAGLYEVMVGPVVVYTSADGRYLVKGEIYDLERDRNLTEERVAEARVRTLAEIPEKNLIVFGPADAEYSVTVFTDVSCGYCRLLHSKIDEYNQRGIRVRYAAYPRNGLASAAWQTMERVWCANDRREALTLAKLDREFEAKQCETDDVMEQWQLGRMLGVRGTPALFTERGELIPGYLPPDALLQRLKAGR